MNYKETLASCSLIRCLLQACLISEYFSILRQHSKEKLSLYWLPYTSCSSSNWACIQSTSLVVMNLIRNIPLWAMKKSSCFGRMVISVRLLQMGGPGWLFLSCARWSVYLRGVSRVCSNLLVLVLHSHGLAGLMWLRSMAVILAQSRSINVTCFRGKVDVGGKGRCCSGMWIGVRGSSLGWSLTLHRLLGR